MAVGCVVVACILIVVGYTSLDDFSFRQRQFDSSAWRDGDVRVRGEMVQSLREQLIGKSRDEILTLLGKPDKDHGRSLHYRVDVGRRLFWRPFVVTLFVEFDDRMRVYRAGIVD